MHCGNGQMAVPFLYSFCTVLYGTKCHPPLPRKWKCECCRLTCSLKMQSQKIDRPSWIAIPAIHHQQTRKRLPKIPEEKEEKVKKGKCEMPKLFLLLLLLNLHTHIQFSKRWCSYFGWMLGRGRESHRLATTSRRGDSHFFPLFLPPPLHPRTLWRANIVLFQCV